MNNFQHHICFLCRHASRVNLSNKVIHDRFGKKISETLNRKMHNADQNNTSVVLCFLNSIFSIFYEKIDSYIYAVLSQMYTALSSAQCKFFMEDT